MLSELVPSLPRESKHVMLSGLVPSSPRESKHVAITPRIVVFTRHISLLNLLFLQGNPLLLYKRPFHMVEVFSTNVQNQEQARFLIGHLLALFPEARINFDLEDCDKILRVEDESPCVQEIINLLSTYGFLCDLLL